jgi:hypothetical protein
MKPHLNAYQRSFAQQQIVFGSGMLSPEIAEALRRASLACAENQKKETEIIDFICGLYLQYRNDVAIHFSGDLPAIVSRNFPVHRFGHEGLVPKVMLEQMASRDESCDAGVGFSLNYNDELLRLLWSSAKLANAVGKKASLMDVIAAITLDRGWMEELRQIGLRPSRIVADFDTQVGAVIFHASPHTGKAWPREMEFECDETFQSPFVLEVSTPSGPFQPVRSGKVKLNGNDVARVAWPENPVATTGVELHKMNKIEFELDGPPFGSVEVIARGTPV